ncbi:ABC transporter permease [Propionibacteriaceae bacterium Y1700]|uniref:ABC transporter permease n=1 Tax=Microlunatus sp. Y1700 TaxID=3418487 RepID=UPI003DA738B5
MNALASELIKLKRSMGWVAVLLLPILLVAVGAANTVASDEPLADGWHTLWLRSMVFGGLFPLQIGVAVLASLVWRVEHRGTNWNVLMSGPTSTWRIVTAKAAVVAGLSAAMQLILLAAVQGAGWMFGLPGAVPAEYVGLSLVIMVAYVPVAVLQSSLSMLLRSFAAPVAVALVGAGVSVVLLMAGLGVAIASPYGLLTRATQLGTGTFVDSGTVTPVDVITILLVAVLVTAGLLFATVRLVDRRDTRT